jgi:hypothetical protein
MANIRELKKEVNNLVYELISDCFIYSGLHADDKKDKVTAILSEAVNLRNDLIARINNLPGKADPKVVRSHLRMVKSDLIEGVDSLFGKLSSLSGQK